MASFGIDEWMELERSARLTDSAFGEMDLDADLYLGLMRQVGRRQRPPLVFWASCWQEARAKMWTEKE